MELNEHTVPSDSIAQPMDRCSSASSNSARFNSFSAQVEENHAVEENHELFSSYFFEDVSEI